MADQSFLDKTTPTMAPTNPHEIALQSLCKQLLKSRLFRGFYLERLYVEDVKDYRDLVCLQKSEKSLEKMLRDIRDKLQLFYSYQNPHIWIGITGGSLAGISKPPPAALETYLWVELKDLAFIEYWFSIKSIRFRDNEVIIKLKVVQPVEQDATPKWSPNNVKVEYDKSNLTPDASADLSKDNSEANSDLKKLVTFDDFMLLIQQWWMSIKQTVYAFMAEDISKDNLIGVLRFLGLFFIFILSSTVTFLHFLGSFTLGFMMEISRLTHALTPVCLKIIDVFSKIIGGFFILLSMVWKDAVVNRNQPKHVALEYNRPAYKSIHYDVRQRRQESSPTATSFQRNLYEETQTLKLET